MARISVRPDLTGTTHMVAVAPVLKMADAATGQIAIDRESGANLYVVQLLETFEGTAQLIKVTVPEPGIDLSLSVGAIVRPTGLVASVWANLFNGQVSSGLSYRAQAITALTPATPVKTGKAIAESVAS